MISAYNSLVAYEGDEWDDYLEKLCLIDIFMPLLKQYPDKGDFKCIVKYILYAYSVESDMLVIGADWHKTKKKIFEKSGLKPELTIYSEVVHLKSKVVLETIKRWLEYQDNDVFEMLITMKELRAEMQLTCLTDIKTASGEINYDQKYKNAQYSVELKKTIKDLESELIQNNPLLKESVKEFREATRVKKSFGSETFLKEEYGDRA